MGNVLLNTSKVLKLKPVQKVGMVATIIGATLCLTDQAIKRYDDVEKKQFRDKVTDLVIKNENIRQIVERDIGEPVSTVVLLDRDTGAISMEVTTNRFIEDWWVEKDFKSMASEQEALQSHNDSARDGGFLDLWYRTTKTFNVYKVTNTNGATSIETRVDDRVMFLRTIGDHKSDIDDYKVFWKKGDGTYQQLRQDVVAVFDGWQKVYFVPRGILAIMKQTTKPMATETVSTVKTVTQQVIQDSKNAVNQWWGVE